MTATETPSLNANASLRGGPIRWLILGGALLIAAIMVGTTIHNLQGLGWIPTTATSFQLDLAWGRWLGLYANWQGIGGQLAARRKLGQAADGDVRGGAM